MTIMENYDKRKLIILRAVLIVIGASVGCLALWQYFVYYPDVVSHEYRIVITIVSSVLVALMSVLSAKPFYRLGASIGLAIAAANGKVGGKGIAASVLGFIAAGVLVVVFDVVFGRMIEIWAVRLLVDILTYIVCTAGCCYGFIGWVNASPKAEKSALPAVGYLLAAECFTDSRVVAAVNTFINVKVLDCAYKALCLFGGDKAAEAVKLLDEFIESGAVGVIKTNAEFSDDGEYKLIERSVSETKRLRLVNLDGGDDCLGLSVLGGR